MYPDRLIRKHICPKGKNWLARGKAPLSAAKAHKLKSM